MAHARNEDEDEAMAAIGRSYEAASEIAKSVSPNDPGLRDLRELAVQALAQIPKLSMSATIGDTWAAVYLALRVGLLEGLMQAYPRQYHTKRSEEVRKQLRRAGGKALGLSNLGRRKVSSDQVVHAFTQLRADHQKWSTSRTIKRVAEDLGVSPSTVRARLREKEVIPETRG